MNPYNIRGELESRRMSSSSSSSGIQS